MWFAITLLAGCFCDDSIDDYGCALLFRGDGHIARNIRLALLTADVVQPYERHQRTPLFHSPLLRIPFSIIYIRFGC